MKKLIGISLFCSVALASSGQFIDTIQAALERKANFTFSFDTRDSYINNNYANIFGVMAGVCFGGKFTLGGGYNALSSPIYKTQYIGEDVVHAKLSFYYFSYFAEYTINFTKHWELDLPVLIGIGNSSYQYTFNDNVVSENGKVIMPLEPQVSLDYNFNKYVSFSTQVGYRYMLISNNLLNENLNSITYSVGLSISPFEIYASLFPHTKWAKMIESNE